ncbi:MAG TPA: Crp/Fnr family transcriptional regulator [Saprospiraceae bacterium]|jgi:CRP/FNR family transcriptional regulator|nr:Crp/Fnr family transcriptional regulator [Saprospiraceae bacterium]HRO07645.1 Crp/Fnr family transcriptional regulator [Saprospiraceae bacterium]HRO72177.1 Crp/Fnr family transcriptional regulator [Saprospiraceae bacterium]HRP40928.1 Crp/Fnr family transcriptional regulator [Saprospiraceae bacterium]
MSIDIIPFDVSCYSKLYEKFQYLFEEDLINEICKNSSLKKFKEDVLILDIGDKMTHIPLVVNGSVKVMREDESGRELLLYYLEVGDTCSVTMTCCTKPSKSIIKAISETDAEILFIPTELMESWIVKYPSWRSYVLDSYNVRFNELFDAIDNLAFNNMEERLINYLKDKVYVTKATRIHVTHFEIATDLNSSRVVISRLMKKLENDGLITQYRNSVEVKGVL